MLDIFRPYFVASRHGFIDRGWGIHGKKIGAVAHDGPLGLQMAVPHLTVDRYKMGSLRFFHGSKMYRTAPIFLFSLIYKTDGHRQGRVTCMMQTDDDHKDTHHG